MYIQQQHSKRENSELGMAKLACPGSCCEVDQVAVVQSTAIIAMSITSNDQASLLHSYCTGTARQGQMAWMMVLAGAGLAHVRWG